MATRHGYLVRTVAQYGDQPVIGARLPRQHAAFLRSYALRNGMALQAVIRALVADWVAVNQGVNPPPSELPTPLAPIPTQQPQRPDSGKSEQIQALQRIDMERVAKKDAAKVRD